MGLCAVELVMAPTNNSGCLEHRTVTSGRKNTLLTPSVWSGVKNTSSITTYSECSRIKAHNYKQPFQRFQMFCYMLFVHTSTELTIACQTTHIFRYSILVPSVGKYANELHITSLDDERVLRLRLYLLLWYLNGVGSPLRNRESDPGIDEGNVFEETYRWIIKLPWMCTQCQMLTNCRSV